MPFPMKIQPIDVDREPVRTDSTKPVLKSRLKRLFDRPFTSVLRSSSATEKSIPAADGGAAAAATGGGGVTEFEPSSVCLAKMVQNFIEENNNEKQSTAVAAAKCGRNRCNCFNGNSNDSSDDELDLFGGFNDSFTTGGGGSSGDTTDLLKSLTPCASVLERNLSADAVAIVEKNKNVKRKDDLRKIVNDGLSSLGYDSSICKSKWDKSPSFPAGEYDYIDVIMEGERILIDVDFKSEFEIARQTGAYKAIIQSLPFIFVGKPERIGQIVSIVSEAAKQSLKKKGMHLPPWRKAEYMRAKWLSPFTRAKSQNDDVSSNDNNKTVEESGEGELELIFGEKTTTTRLNGRNDDVAVWEPPEVNPMGLERGAKVVAGLASLLKEQP